MSLLALISFVTGVAGVWLTIRQRIACWPVGLVSVVTSAVEFYRERLFGDMSLQAFYFVAGVYGWIVWERERRKPFVITFTPPAAWAPIALLTAATSAAFFFLLKRFGGDRAFLDALLTACSLAATYMMTRKWLENWIAWVAIDGTYILLYGLKGMWIFAALYFFFAVMAAFGYARWRKATS